MLRGVAVVWMPVQDIDRAKGFYKDTLGLRITNVDGEWAEVDANGLTLGLNGREPSGAQGEGGPSLPSSPRGAWKRPSMASRPRGSRSPPVSPSSLGPRGDLGGRLVVQKTPLSSYPSEEGVTWSRSIL
jgi:hypothetical protein